MPVSGAEKTWLGDNLRAVWSAATKKNDNPGCFSGVAIKRRKYPEQGPPTKTYAAARLLCRGNDSHGRCLRDDRSAHVIRIQTDHLSRLRRLKAHLPCQRIDPARIAQ